MSLSKILTAIVCAAIVAAGLAYLYPSASSPKVEAATASTVNGQDPPARHPITPKPRSPRRQSLDPASFRDPQTRKAYEIARKNPALLEKLACYCGCMESPADAHTSNYECFVDNHGAGCAMCRRIALEAQEMQDQGKSVDAIKKEIDSRYAH